MVPRILLVDDHALLSESVCRLLERHIGAQMSTASDVESAWHVITTVQPQIVISDVELRGPLNGLVLARRIAAHQPHITTLIYSSNSSYARAARAGGARQFLRKDAPDLFNELVVAVRGALGQGG